MLLAVNPTAGQGRGRRAGALAADRLRAAGVRVEAVAAGDAAGLRAALAARLAAAGGPDEMGDGVRALVVVGGDGMVHLGTNLVAGTPVPLGIVPAGTGNDVARALGLPRGDPAAAAGAVLDGLSGEPDARRTLDAVRCANALGVTWVAGAVCAGFDAVVNERANAWRRPRGRLRYVLAAARELPGFGPRRYRLELDGRRTDEVAVLVSVANVPSYGGGMRIAPAARPDDGLLDVLVAGPMSRRRLLALLPRVYAGRHVDDPAVRLVRARRVVVDTPGVVAYADGERLGPLPVTCEVVPAAVTVLAPAVGPSGARRKSPPGSVKG